jgi:glucose-1-phosphate adenylyltransferase
MEVGTTDWYQGTADAVRKNTRYLQQPGVEYVLILSGDQLYRMDFRDMLRTHQESRADVTIAAIPVTRQAAGGLGIMKTDDHGQVTGFVEKPRTEAELQPALMSPAWFDARGVQSQGRDCLANMGIYLFNRDLLVDIMQNTSHQDFGKEVFPQSIHTHRVQAHLFDGYWEDIGTIKAFYEASLSLVRHQPPFDLQLPGAPVYTRARFLPPTRIDGATVKHSLIAEGSQIGDGSVVENSIVGLRCIIGPGVTIRNSIVMGADYYEGALERQEGTAAGRPPMGIGAGTLIDGAIIDKNCYVGRHVRIVNGAGIENAEDNDLCVIRDGIPVAIKGASLPDHWKL